MIERKFVIYANEINPIAISRYDIFTTWSTLSEEVKLSPSKSTIEPILCRLIVSATGIFGFVAD